MRTRTRREPDISTLASRGGRACFATYSIRSAGQIGYSVGSAGNCPASLRPWATPAGLRADGIHFGHERRTLPAPLVGHADSGFVDPLRDAGARNAQAGGDFGDGQKL